MLESRSATHRIQIGLKSARCRAVLQNLHRPDMEQIRNVSWDATSKVGKVFDVRIWRIDHQLKNDPSFADGCTVRRPTFSVLRCKVVYSRLSGVIHDCKVIDKVQVTETFFH
ncbi:Uncharacterised protein r2_g137 [Pycnogonum litorale]